MKKVILLSLALVMVLSSVAQIKRVAILKTIDKENEVPGVIEAMVRSNLTKVISSIEGYEGYDRVNIAEIMDEHAFERTGMVSEDQIRKMGEISGADYILVSEVYMYNESTIFVDSRILSVETAKIESSENAEMTNSAPDIQHGCESLANRLLGRPDSYADKPNNQKGTIFLTQKPIKKQTEKSVPSSQKTTPFTTPSVSGLVGTVMTFPDGTSGLVFYMDENGRGLVVSLKEGEEKWDKNRRSNHIEMVEKLDDDNTMMSYGLGRTNTQAIINALGEKGGAAYWCLNQGPEWYLPSCGELYLLVTILNGNPYVNELLNSSGGGKIDGWYWSSTENDNDEAWNISSSGRVSTEEKNESVKVRAIRAFTK